MIPETPTASPTADSYLAYLLVTMGLERHHRVLELGRKDPNPFLRSFLADDSLCVGSGPEDATYHFIVRYTATGSGTLEPPPARGWERSFVDVYSGDATGAPTMEGQHPVIPPPAGLEVRVLLREAATPPEKATTTLIRNQAEIERYKDAEIVHDLPQIFHFWSHRYVLPKLQACGLDSIDDLFLGPMTKRLAEEPATCHDFASLGAGNCDFELHLAGLLRQRSFDNFRFHCLELNPYMLERGSRLASERSLARHFTFTETDIEDWQPERRFAVCLANHSLHHFAALEPLLDSVTEVLVPGGAFVINDMIGRNGHQRWPEAQEILERIWRSMPERYKYNHQLQRTESEFVNWDCSEEGNEGIRAQDILPLLLERFHFEIFIAFANLIDVFVDRSFGYNFDPEKSGDRDFIVDIAERDERAIDDGVVKPTHLLAVMRCEPAQTTRVYRHWTPEFCVRRPDRRPQQRNTAASPSAS